MVLFRNRQETLAKTSKYALSHLNAPGNLYTNRRDEVDADGNLDDLVQQEIRRYEELFEQSNDAFASPGDDDTLQDGSIYTSMQASTTILPSLPPKSSEQKQKQHHEDDSLWGLENLPPLHPKPKAAEKFLLNPHEAAAAKACGGLKSMKSKSDTQASIVPPVSAVPVKQKEAEAESATSELKDPDTQPAKQTPFKKNKFKPSFPKRFFGASQSSNNTLGSQRTHASTPTPSTKSKFFSPAKIKIFKTSKASKQQHHSNLLLASVVANNKKMKDKQAPALVATMNHQQQAPINQNATEQVQRSSSASCPSPTPPIDQCEIELHCGGDGMSVSSAQSSLTDALDAWMVHHTPPKIIGGDHLQVASPNKFESYEVGITPYHNVSFLGGDNDIDEEEEEEVDGDIKGSPSELLLTEGLLYFHNHNSGKSMPSSPLRAKQHESLSSNHENASNDDCPCQDNLAAMVWADKEQRQLLKETKALVHEDLNPEDADMQAAKILGLQDGTARRRDGVKRNLFGDNNDTGANDVDGQEAELDMSLANISLLPLQQVVPPDDEDVEEEKVPTEATEVPEEKMSTSATNVVSQQGSRKSSKFKRFLSKLVNANAGNSNNGQSKKSEQQQQLEPMTKQKWLEQERVKAKEAEIERQRIEMEETKRIQEKKQQELERQRALELGSYYSHTSDTGHTSAGSGSGTLEECAARARSFSLMTGQMKPDTDDSRSATQDIKSFPENRLPAEPSVVGETPAVASLANLSCVFCHRLDHPRTHIVIPCMHYVLCDECVEHCGEASEDCHCPTCNTRGFLYARVGILAGPELEAKLLQVNRAAAAAGATTETVFNQ